VSLTGAKFVGPARRDLGRIFKSSETQFGVAARKRYETLVRQAIRDLVENPDRIGAQHVEERIHYHLRHSRNRVAGDRVKDPRHVLVCKIIDGVLLILAVGHDAMEGRLTRRIEEGEAD
jgi:toxin ParE1/3/4